MGRTAIGGLVLPCTSMHRDYAGSPFLGPLGQFGHNDPITRRRLREVGASPWVPAGRAGGVWGESVVASNFGRLCRAMSPSRFGSI